MYSMQRLEGACSCMLQECNCCRRSSNNRYILISLHLTHESEHFYGIYLYRRPTLPHIVSNHASGWMPSLWFVVEYGATCVSSLSVFDEEPGLPSPPMDEAALLGVSTASVDMFQVLAEDRYFKYSPYSCFLTP